MEALGKVHPTHRIFGQWDQMEAKERELQLRDLADTYILTADRFEHSAIFIHGAPGGEADLLRLIEIIREKSGNRYFLMMHGDATYGIPSGERMMEFTMTLADEPEQVKAKADEMVDSALARGERLKRPGGLDGFALCSDYCLNAGPFLSPGMFSEFVTPYLARLVKGYHAQGYYTIKHTDGNIMPILDQLVQCRPHALHSLDPQGGVDIAEVKRLYGKDVCLIGNVNCGLLDTGTDEEADAAVRYALRHGMPGGGYIFSTSNCVYTGMRLRRYERMLEIWRSEGNY
jgi:uroporphyrinogen decarboxylase